MAEQTTQGQETALDLDEIADVLSDALADANIYPTFVLHGDAGRQLQVYVTAEEAQRLTSILAERDSWARRFASVEEELNEKTEQVLALHRAGDVHPWGPVCRECGWNYLPCATARIFAGPSSVADYELLGTPVEDKQ